MKSSPDHSDEKAFRVAYLIAGYIRKTLTVEEHDELDAWVEESDENMKLFEDLTDEDHIEANLAWMDRVQTEKVLAQTKAQLTFQPEKAVPKSRNVRTWWPYMAAASVILVIAAYFLLRSGSDLDTPDGTPKVAQTPGEVLPGGNRATLTLSDGRVVDLASAGNGLIKKEEGTAIQKTGEGTLAYRPEAGNASLLFNTLYTPIGGQYAVTLSDGTRVWLNAASSLKYPIQFGSGNRTVELTGEGYFEVAKNNEKPFIVHLTGGNQIQVLGTHFNAQTYQDESAQQITLLEGSVRVLSQKADQILKPGQQALIEEGTIALNPNVDLEGARGWKEGSFVFHDADIQAIMRQVRRWYSVDVVFNTKTSEHFNATISRKEPLSRLLRLLELTGKIHFKIENKTVYVLP